MAPPMIIAAGVSAAGSLLAGQSAMAAGRYQKGIADRNAEIYDSKADQALAIGERNVKVFNKSFAKQQASTEVAYIAAGVRLSGTPLEVLEHNLTEAEMERQNILYDSQVTSDDFRQQAISSRLEGEYAMFNARAQRASAFLNAAGTMVGAYATNNLIKTQAANAKILNKEMLDQQKLLIDISNNNMKRTIRLQIDNAEKYHQKFGSILN